MTSVPEAVNRVAAVDVRAVVADDDTEMAGFALRNRDFHVPDLLLPTTEVDWREASHSPGQRWYRVSLADGTVAGVLSLSRWSPSPWRTAEVGAGADERLAGQGFVAAGLRELLTTVFTSGALARVEALVRPDNVGSERLFSATGFRREGTIRGALDRGNGRIDLTRWAVLSSDRLRPLPREASGPRSA